MASASALLLVLLATPPAPPPIVAQHVPSVRKPTPAPTCLPASVTRNATVVMLGMYGGKGARTPFGVSGDGHRARSVVVTGRAHGKVVLVLAAYEPTIWDLSAIRGRIRAVVASGNYPQAVAGLPRSIPVRFANTFGRGDDDTSACGAIPYAYAGTAQITRMAEAAERATGDRPRRFYGGYDPTGFDIDGGVTAIPRSPNPDDIRSAVPLETFRPPHAANHSIEARLTRHSAGMDERTDEDASVRSPATRIVEWDGGGQIIRDEGGGTIAPRRDANPYGPPMSPRSRGLFGAPSAFWLILIGAFAVWMWRRLTVAARAEPDMTPRSDPRWRVPPEALAAPDPPAPTPPTPPASAEAHLTDLAALAAMTGSESLVIALHRYGRELRTLPRLRFDADLADEVDVIVARHFPHAANRYRQARPSLDGAEGDHADEALRRAVERLAQRLHELQDAQHRRDMDGIDAAARFIDSRHAD